MELVFINPWWLGRYAWPIVALLCLTHGALIVGFLLQRKRRRQVEDRLQRHRATADAVIHSLPVLYYLTDATGTLFRWNQAVEKVSGYSPAEIGAKNVTDLIAEGDRGAHQRMVQEVLEKGEAHAEAAFLTKAGIRIPYYITEVLFRINGKPYRAGLGMDLSERKQTEEALRNVQQRQQLMLDQMPAILWTVDPNLRFTSSMGAALKSLSLKPGQTNGMNLFQFFRGQDCLDVCVEAHRKALSGESASYELLWKDRGYTSYVEPLRNEDGEITGVIGVALDITERRQVEEALRQAKKAAEAATRAKSEFLANMSHEIRTPLNGVMGLLELAQQTRLDPEQKELVRMARDSADALLLVLSDILDFSKIEAGKLVLEQEEFELADVVADAIQTMTTRAHQKKLELSYYVAPEISPRLIGDSTRLKQVLMNLLANAIKFTEHGEVVLRVGRDSQTAEEITLEFSVSDTGIGIAPDQQQAIFGAFSQADSSTTRRFGGTGLGLTICARIVDLMGGRIWVESEPGRGSTFFFTARLGVAPPLQAEGAVRYGGELRNLRALVVDDNPTSRLMLQQTLSTWGMQVVVAESGAAAMRAIEQAAAGGNPFDLLLSDYVAEEPAVPEQPGVPDKQSARGLALQFQRHPEWAKAAIFMLTSDEYSRTAGRRRELGLGTHLIKPVKQSELLEVICKLLLLHQDVGEKNVEEKSDVTAIAHADSLGRLKILLAEDNQVNQEVAVRMLERMGHAVTVVTTGKDALRQIQQQHFDVVLMDVHMPEMDGFEATTAIRAWEKQQGVHTAIIATTANAMQGDREACLDAGMDGYLSKPMSRAALATALHQAVQDPAKRPDVSSR